MKIEKIDKNLKVTTKDGRVFELPNFYACNTGYNAIEDVIAQMYCDDEFGDNIFPKLLFDALWKAYKEEEIFECEGVNYTHEEIHDILEEIKIDIGCKND